MCPYIAVGKCFTSGKLKHYSSENTFQRYWGHVTTHQALWPTKVTEVESLNVWFNNSDRKCSALALLLPVLHRNTGSRVKLVKSYQVNLMNSSVTGIFFHHSFSTLYWFVVGGWGSTADTPLKHKINFVIPQLKHEIVKSDSTSTDCSSTVGCFFFSFFKWLSCTQHYCHLLQHQVIAGVEASIDETWKRWVSAPIKSKAFITTHTKKWLSVTFKVWKYTQTWEVTEYKWSHPTNHRAEHLFA